MGALQHFLERAAADHIEAFDAWFPAGFDWARLCGDVPRLAREGGVATEGLPDEDLVKMARAVFRGAHLFTLAVLAAGSEGRGDPQDLLSRLTSPPDEEVEEHFLALAEELLPSVEARIPIETSGAEQSAPPKDDDEGVDEAEAAIRRAVALVRATAPAVEHVLANDESRVFARAGETAGVLWALARVAAALAALRWMASERLEEDWPRLDLAG